MAGGVGHVFVIVLENKSYDVTFGSGSAAPYLAQTLPSMGALLKDYYSTGHASLDNYIAMISGQAPNTDTQNDCPIVFDTFLPSTGSDGQIQGLSCMYPKSVLSLADQFKAAGIAWKGYMEDMGNQPSRYDSALAPSSTRPQGPRTCGHATVGGVDNTQSATASDQYATRHDPFMYFHSIIDDQAYCDQHVVNLYDDFVNDLKSIDTTPQFSFITPNLCNDGHDSSCADGEVGGLIGINRFLKEWVPVIMKSAAYQRDGLLIVVYDESTNSASNSSDMDACCGESGSGWQAFFQPGILGPGGGRVGAVVLSPFVAPGTVSAQKYNHYSLLRTIEDIFGLAYLGHAADGNTANSVSPCDNNNQPCSFGADVYTQNMPVFPPRPK